MSRSASPAALASGLLAAVLVAAAVAAPSANAATDSTVPTLSGPVTFTPSTVDTTTADASSTVSTTLADDASGVASATLTLTAPGGAFTADVELARTAGTATNGTWTGVQTFSSQFDPAGKWTPTALSITDSANNTANVTSGLGAGVTVTRTVDSTAPVLVGADTTTTAVDTTTGPVDVPVRVRATDDLSGVDGGTVTFTSPDGDVAEGYLSGDPTDGTARNGSWTVPVTFPARSVGGVWRLSSLSLTDSQYNVAEYNTDDVELPNLAVRVTTAADPDAPALTSFRIGPAKLSTAYGRSGYVYAQVAFTDAVSGLASAQVVLQRPGGVVDDSDADPVAYADADIRSGTSRNGTLSVPIFVENFAAGSWVVDHVTLTDVAGNSTNVATAALGSRAGFEVSAAAADTKAPVTSGYVFSPTTLDTRGAARSGTVLVAVTDPDAVPSGVARGSLVLTSASGQQSTAATFTADDMVAGDPSDGTFRAAFSLPANAEDGQWRVSSATVTDVAGKAAPQTSFATAPTLTVLGQGRAPATPPGAPTIGTATVSDTTATVSWTPPASDGGAAITRYTVGVLLDGTQVATRSATGTGTTVPDLLRGRSYAFTVTAENGAGTGTPSARSNTITVPALAPGAPAIGRADLADPTGTTATVGWTAPSDTGGAAITGYVVTPYLGTVAQPTTSVGTVSTASLTGLLRGRSYTFRVAAQNSAGTGTPSAASNSVTPAATVPAAPQVISATPSATSATIRWTVPDDGGAAITGYRVTGSPSGSCTSVTTTCTVAGLDPAQSYTFVVTAANGVGSSQPSAPSRSVVAQPTPAPAPQPQPASLVVTRAPASVPYGATTVVAGRLTSAANGAGLAGQVVTLQYRPASGGGWASWPTTSRTGGDGSVSFGFRPGRSVQVQLVSQPTDGYLAATSSARTIAVTRGLSLGGRSKVARGGRVVLTGHATPMRAGRVLLQRYVNGWRTVASAPMHGTSYRFTVRPTKRGSYAYRVVTSADAVFAMSTSSTRTVRAR